VPPVKGQYFDVITPVSGKVYTKVARSGAEDIELAAEALRSQNVSMRTMKLRSPHPKSR
jgi:aldehyde dehydrogenase